MATPPFPSMDIAQELLNFQIRRKTAICIRKLSERRSDEDVPSVLLVLGRKGAGKSAVMQDITAWLSLSPLTRGWAQSQVMSTRLEGQEFIFIDTPEFECDINARKVLFDTMKSVSRIPNNIKISGVIFVTSSEPPLLLDFEREFLDWLLAFCGVGFLPQITLIITDESRSGGSTDKNGEQWKALWAQFLARGAIRTYYYRSRFKDSLFMFADHEDPLSGNMGEILIRNYVGLQIQNTQFDRKLVEVMSIEETTAARVLCPADARLPKTSEVIEATFQSDSQSPGLVSPELLPGKLFGNLLVQPELGNGLLPTAAPCPICHNFTEYLSEINVEEAKCRASTGCLGCKLITCAYEKFIQEDNLGILGMEPKDSFHKEENAKKGHEIFSKKAKNTICTADIHASSENSVAIRSNRSIGRYEIFTTAEVSARHGRNGIRWGRIPLDYSGSNESFDIISSWMQDCCRNHNGCNQSNNPLPNRVLDIGSLGKIRLCSGKGKSGSYCALSHCWGSSSNKPARTTKATVKFRKWNIDEGSLSKTFRQAIAVARYLSIQYIWIDSLCIIQDDKEDWVRESSNMAAIYENASLVIAATQAEHGGVGCFSSRNPSSTLCFEIPQVNDQVAPVYMRPRKHHLHFLPSAAYNASLDPRYPLLSRAWCLQERLLATRVVHFTREELVWECRTTSLCECGSLDHSDGSNSAFKRRWAVDRELPKLFDLWHKTLKLYSSLQITHESDRLPALSGLAKQLEVRGCGEYVAGVWVKNILAELMWYSATTMTRPAEWKAPSWSWACGEESRINFLMQNDNSPETLLDVENLRGPHQPSKTPKGGLFKTALVSVVNELNGPNMARNIKTPILTISAPATNVSLLQDSGQWKLQKGGKELRPSYLDCPAADFEGMGTKGEEISLFCAWVGTVRGNPRESGEIRPCILLLQPSRGLGEKAAVNGCYERVGVLVTGRWNPDERQLATILGWFEDAEVCNIRVV